MQLNLDRNADIPIYRQIVSQVTERVRRGELPAGSRLPAVRELAHECKISNLTVYSAYAELQAQGLVEARVGRGTFVSSSAAPPSPLEVRDHSSPWLSEGSLSDLLPGIQASGTLSFAQAFPAPETYPDRDLAQSFTKVLRDPASLGYGTTQGERELRDQIAVLLLARGLSVPADQMIITAGAQQGIDLILRGLTEAHDVILVEEPIYPGVLEVARRRGQPVVGIPNENGVLRMDVLEAACRAHRPRLIYLVPAYNNPTGRTLTPESREAVLRAAGNHGLLVVEDDTYGFLGADTQPPPALTRSSVDDMHLYVSSFSKILTPGLRLGVVVAPVSMLPALGAIKQSSDLVTSALSQLALADYLRHGLLASHLMEMRKFYRQRRDVMLEALQRHLPSCRWSHPEGGLSLWVDLPAGIVERDFVADAVAHGVAVAPGSLFFPRPRQRSSMRLSFSLQSPEKIEEGISTLGRVLETHMTRRNSPSVSGLGAAGPLV